MRDDRVQPFPRDVRRDISVADEPVEVRRYLTALRREWWLVALIVGIATTVAFLISLTADTRYQASARIVFEDIDTLLQRQDVESVKRELATLETLVETPSVLAEVAKRFPGLSIREVDENVSVSADPDTNIIRIVAIDGDPTTAAALANIVVSTFLANRRDLERAKLRRARAALVQQLGSLRGSTGNADEVAALQARVSELGVLIAGAGSELQIAETALPPESPYAPRPFRNALIALFASILIAAVVVFAREQMRPRISSARELSRLLGLPVLARVPWVRSRARGIMTAGEYDAYQSLQASLRFREPSGSQKIVLVTSTVPHEGKSTVAAGLGVSLALSGAHTLLISADLRSPTLHEYFGAHPKPGLRELLGTDLGTDGEQLRQLILGSTEPLRPRLDLLGSTAAKRGDVANLLSGERLEALFEGLAQLPYEYVLVDAPPLLGIPDSRLLARVVNTVLVVGRPDRLTPDLALDMHEALDTLDAPVLGLVLVGAGSEYPAYGEREDTLTETAIVRKQA